MSIELLKGWTVAPQNITLPGGATAMGESVDFAESKERWSEFTLEDGTVIRAKITLVSAIRVIGQYTPDGMPMYVLQAQPVMATVSARDEFKQPAQA